MAVHIQSRSPFLNFQNGLSDTLSPGRPEQTGRAKNTTDVQSGRRTCQELSERAKNLATGGEPARTCKEPGSLKAAWL